MAVPKAIAAKIITCRVGLKRRAASFRVAGVALRDFPTRFLTCQTSVCVTGAILLQGFPKMISIFRGRRSTLEIFIFILQCRRSTLGVSSCVFLNRIVRLRCHNVQMGVGHRESVILHGRRSTDDVATCHSRLDPPSTFHTFRVTCHSTFSTLHFALRS